jgi:hypothetical protein
MMKKKAIEDMTEEELAAEAGGLRAKFGKKASPDAPPASKPEPEPDLGPEMDIDELSAVSDSLAKADSVKKAKGADAAPAGDLLSHLRQMFSSMSSQKKGGSK